MPSHPPVLQPHKGNKTDQEGSVQGDQDKVRHFDVKPHLNPNSRICARTRTTRTCGLGRPNPRAVTAGHCPSCCEAQALEVGALAMAAKD